MFITPSRKVDALKKSITCIITGFFSQLADAHDHNYTVLMVFILLYIKLVWSLTLHLFCAH